MKRFNRILLIDDDHISNHLSSTILEEMELTDKLIVLNDGQMALDYVEQHCIHGNLHQHLLHKSQCVNLILLDLKMPLIDGFDFLRAFNDLEKVYNVHIATVVILTSSKSQEDIVKALQFNVAGYIEKPLSREKVEQLIDVLVH